MVGSASKMETLPSSAYRFSDEHYTIEELVSWMTRTQRVGRV